MIDVFRQAFELECLGNAVHAPGLCTRFECAQQDLTGVFLVIGVFVHDAQDGQVLGYAVQRLGDDVEMLSRMKREVHTDRGAQVAGPHAACDDDGLGADFTLVGHDTDCATAFDNDLGNLRVFEDFRAAHTRAFRESLGGIDRVRLTIRRQDCTADQIVHMQERIVLFQLARRQHFAFQTKAHRHGRHAFDLFHPRFRLRGVERAVSLEARRLARFLFQREQQVGSVLCEVRHIAIGAKLSDEACRVPGRPARQLLPFTQDNIVHADLG